MLRSSSRAPTSTFRRRGAPRLALLCCLWTGCPAGDPQQGLPDVEDEAAARALWSRLQDEEYRSFARAPGYEERQPAQGPHGATIDLYVNGVMDEALGAPEGSLAAWPDGALVVKDAFGADGALELTAVLDKQAGAFTFAEFEPDGSPLFYGTPSLCVGCHAEGSDSVLAFELP